MSQVGDTLGFSSSRLWDCVRKKEAEVGYKLLIRGNGGYPVGITDGGLRLLKAQINSDLSKF